ncbi:hypothetical protein AYJ57_13095 [Salipiger sp. CCB-MM3]|uniref:Hint domain-containing protein n=1 Tax=Salipiger sp. CCB-MM3 TaxID=1792508 RepID=UPI00080A95DF|nr:Hint domain-containing protein [Salipiger sp. CCB-MM3]ANT61224.1 hypothetical protein AYJ57_13095 [Salipiger sp. CCB-MM3]
MEPKTVRRDDGALPARHIDSSCRLNALVAGTTVLTLDGALPAEYLSPGDRVITRDSGVAILRRVRHFRRAVAMVAITAGSLGNSRPEGDTVLPADQEILMRGWRASALFGASQALVPLSRIEDGHFVRALGHRSAILVALSFDQPHILYGDGLELASADPVPLPA